MKGAVKFPKVYSISSDLRVDDLITLAGGFTAQADQNSVNLAAKLKDEEVIYIAKVGEQAPSALTESQTPADTTSSGQTGSSTTEKVNINTADLTELQTLSGIGAKKAQDIIDYRTQNGPFQAVEDLGNVSGFGDKTLAKLKDSITVN